MLSQEDNRILTQTGPGTPMGNLFRRYWIPALVPSELPEPDSPPIRFRILGEDLVAFRDTEGRVGFFKQACPHRGASMFFGRNEEAGLRCVYHGWKFDVNGDCVDMPSEPAESNFKSKVRIQAYASAEFGGLVWIYMGPKDKQPPLPEYEWTTRDFPNLKVYKWIQETNYTQGIEGDLDTSHLNFLHRSFVREGLAPPVASTSTSRPNCRSRRRTSASSTAASARRRTVRTTGASRPTSSPGSRRSLGPAGRAAATSSCLWTTSTPGGSRSRRRAFGAAAGQPDREHVVLIPGTFRQTHNSDNDYMIDREMQRTVNYTGLLGNRIQDSAVTESMGPIYDRTKEHLGTSDLAIIFFRKQLIRMALDLENGIEHPMLNDPSLFRARPVDIMTDTDVMAPIWDEDRRQHLAEAMPPIEVSTS